MENRLDTIATICLIFAIFSAAILIFLSQEDVYKQSGLSSILVGVGIGMLFQGLIFWSILGAFSEVIRLLKRSNDIPYYGNISGYDDTYEDEDDEINNTQEKRIQLVECESCGAKIPNNVKYCEVCGSKNIPT